MISWALVFLSCLNGVSAREPRPPGPPLAPQTAFGTPASRPGLPAGDGDGRWDTGDWSDDEQLVLERMNRARQFPLAETGILKASADSRIQYAYEFFLVDFSVLSNHMATLPPVPPLAPHRMLLQTARGHSQWMLANAEQSHFEGTSDVFDRVASVGYPLTIVAENLYAFAENGEYAHAGLEVDWGFPDASGIPKPPGMQNPPGHRLNNHDGRLREVGVGLVHGTNSRSVGGVTETVGPALFTVNFGNRSDATPLVTGVAYFDLDGNGQYDVGEGIGGVRVDVSGSDWHAVTSSGGGYAVPSANGARDVSFSARGMTTSNRTVTVSGGANLKADLRLAYVDPTLSGPATPAVGLVNHYTLSSVPAASAFNWSAARRSALAGRWGAEQGLQRVTATVSPGYEVANARWKAAGAFSYRLTNPKPDDQLLRLEGSFLGGTQPVLSFSILVGYATESQVLHADVSEDDGITWKSMWNRAGITGQSASSFTRVTVPLTHLARRDFLVRFRLTVGLGSYYNTTESGEGMYLDEIELADTSALTPLSIGQVPVGRSIPFVPPSLGDYALGVQSVIGTRTLPRSPWTRVTAVAAPAQIRMEVPSFLGGQLELPFVVESGQATAFVLESKANWGTGWKVEGGAVLSTLSPGRYQYRVPPVGEIGYYRVRVP